MRWVVPSANVIMLAAWFAQMEVVGTLLDVALWQHTSVYSSVFPLGITYMIFPLWLAQLYL